jgi:hypothetical protein
MVKGSASICVHAVEMQSSVPQLHNRFKIVYLSDVRDSEQKLLLRDSELVLRCDRFSESRSRRSTVNGTENHLRRERLPESRRNAVNRIYANQILSMSELDTWRWAKLNWLQDVDTWMFRCKGPRQSDVRVASWHGKPRHEFEFSAAGTKNLSSHR